MRLGDSVRDSVAAVGGEQAHARWPSSALAASVRHASRPVDLQEHTEETRGLTPLTRGCARLQGEAERHS